MKTQTNNQIKRQLILVFIVLSFIAGSFAQNSAIALNKDYNFKQLKHFFEALNNEVMNYKGQYLQLSEVSDALLSSVGSEIDKMTFAPKWTASDAFMVSEQDEELVVEDWMMDENHFMVSPGNNEVFEAEEEKLVVEDWMLDESNFLTSDANLHSEENITEDEMQVEDWMLDPNHWVSGAE